MRVSRLFMGLELAASAADAFAAYIKSELAKWAQVFREVGLHGEVLR